MAKTKTSVRGKKEQKIVTVKEHKKAGKKWRLTNALRQTKKGITNPFSKSHPTSQLTSFEHHHKDGHKCCK